ncbi:MAG: reverse transcriptase domain-containing protein, partial [Clostridia bacterium]|nr:reverse transcriptase domain-containing protein [Clostridia bacterium]
MSVKKLPDDYYAVYKNITKYSKCELEDLLKIYGLENNENGINELNHKDRVLTSSEFNIFKKENPKIVEKNPNNYGIPQGSAISAVLSNIYMIKADCELNNYIKNKNGLYMRYCDDFIIVLPTNNEFAFRCQYRQIKLIIDNIPNVILSKEKTQIFNFNNRLLENCNNKFLSDVQKGKDIINYLGFSFDGK